MKKITMILLAVMAALVSPAQKNKQSHTYKITGTVTGFADSSLIYLSDLADGSYKDIDSTYILNEKFSFKGSLNHNIELYAIHTQGYKDRVSFWIDHSPTFISAQKGAFKKAVIKGSKAQAENEELIAMSSDPKNKNPDYIKFIRTHPTSIVSAKLLDIYSSTWNKDTVSILYEGLSKTAQNTIYGQQVLDFLSVNVSPAIGDKYVDFEQQNNKGETVKLSGFNGKVILLEFWGSWCAPCREGHPELIKIYNEFKDSGFEILGVAAETDKKIFEKAIQQDGLPWQNVSDYKGDKNKAALIYGISYYPASFLIDRNGIIVAKDLRGDKLKEKLKELLH